MQQSITKKTNILKLQVATMIYFYTNNIIYDSILMFTL